MQRHHVPTAIVGPNLLLCEGLSKVLDKSAFKTVGVATRVEELPLKSLPARQSVLLIIDTCDRPTDAVGQISAFKEKHPEGRIVVLANHCETDAMVAVFRSGANAYFATIATCEDFIKSLDLVMRGQTVLPSEAVATALDRDDLPVATRSRERVEGVNSARPPVGCSDLPRFSNRELYILRCLTEGNSNKVIARECDIAEGTVKVHVKAILRKIQVKNRTQAAIWALNNRSLVWPNTDDPFSSPAVRFGYGTRSIAPTVQTPVSRKIEDADDGTMRQISCVAGTDIS